MKRSTGGGILRNFGRKRKYCCFAVSRHCLDSRVFQNIRILASKLPTSRVLVATVTLSICCLILINSTLRNSDQKLAETHLHVRQEKAQASHSMENQLPDFSSYRVSPRIQAVNSFKGQAKLVNPVSHYKSRSSNSIEGGGETGLNSKSAVSENLQHGSSSGKDKQAYVLVKPEMANLVANASVSDNVLKVFMGADVNRDKYLSAPEISKWINSKMKEHFSEAMKRNFEGFFSIDKDPRNGRVEWSEYLEAYVDRINYSGPKITPSSLRNRTFYKQLPKHVKVDIAALEARWSESALNDPGFLTVDEFLAFNHPEASPSKLLSTVQDTFGTFDLDGDGVISKTEFDTTYAEAEGVDPVYKQDLKFIDANGDEQITRLELMRYMDPKNMIHSDKEAEKIVKDCDDDQDERLSLTEVFSHLPRILSTKFYNVNLYYHSNQLHS